MGGRPVTCRRQPRRPRPAASLLVVCLGNVRRQRYRACGIRYSMRQQYLLFSDGQAPRPCVKDQRHGPRSADMYAPSPPNVRPSMRISRRQAASPDLRPASRHIPAGFRITRQRERHAPAARPNSPRRESQRRGRCSPQFTTTFTLVAPYSHSITNEPSKLSIRMGCDAARIFLPSTCQASASARVCGRFGQS